MGKRLIKRIFIIFLLSVSCNAFAGETIRLANGEWRPFTSKELKHYGVFSRIVSNAFALKGIKAEYVFLPWERGERLSIAGKLDGNIAYAGSEEFEKNFYYSAPIGEGVKVFFHLKDYEFDWQDLSDLHGIKIGAAIGYLFGHAFEKEEREGGLSVTRVADLQALYRMLVLKRVRLVPQTLEVGYDLLNTKFDPEISNLITHHPRPLMKTTFHVIFPKRIKRSKRMLNLFNEGLAQLKKSGKYDAYLEEFRSENYPSK